MASRISNIVISARDAELVARFWCDVLGWHVLQREDDIVCIGPDSKTPAGIDVIPVPDEKTIVNRLHLDLRADGTTTEQELQRLLDLGARRVDIGQGEDVSWVVLADPEGNEFCLLSHTMAEAYG